MSVAAACLVAAIAADTDARAGGFHITIFGVRRTAMETNLGNPDDPTALFANPAGLADLAGTQVQLAGGMTFLDSSTRLKSLDPERFPGINPPGCGQPGKAECPWPVDANGYYKADLRPTSYLGIIPYLGISQNLGRFSERARGVTVSLALYSPGAYGASLPTEAPSAYFVTSGLFLMAAATGGVGWRVNRWLAIGGHLSYNYMRLGYGQKFSTTDVLTPSGQPPDSTAKTAQVVLGDLQLDYTGSDNGLGWNLSALITPARWLGIGLVYGGWTAPRFAGDIRLVGLGTPNQSPEELREITKQFGYKLPVRLVVEQPIPPTLQAGVNLRPNDWIEIGVDYRMWLYTLFDKQRITPIYEAGEGKEPLTEAGLSKSKRYSNSWQLCAGLLVRPLPSHRQLETMAGVGFDKSPVPAETFSLDNPSMDQIFFSVGLRERLGRWRLGASYMFTYYMPRDITTSETSPPTNVKTSALAHLPTIEVSYLY